MRSTPDATPIDPDLARVIGPARLAYFTPISEYPPIADRKASFLMAASGLLTTVLIFFANPIVDIVRGAFTPGHLTRRLVGAVVALAAGAIIVCLLAAALLAYRAFVLSAPPMPPSLANFRHFAALTSDDYQATVRDVSHTKALTDVLHYNYSITQQAAGKFRRVNLALRIMRVAIFIWMALLIAVALMGQR